MINMEEGETKGGDLRSEVGDRRSESQISINNEQSTPSYRQ